MASFKYSPVSVTEQPLPSGKLSLDMQSTPLGFSEKYSDDHECQQHNPHSCEDQCHQHSTSSNHRHCHNGRLRRLLVPALIALVLLGGALAYTCLFHGLSLVGMEDLVARAVTDTASGGESTFTKHKLYLIVIFVGLLVVVILAVMLSAWCCKGAFQNPLCCPCYLCACCGGLACLECIGCGLCAEGLSEM
ncbi:hypothetical protein M413DRAFT_442977 [Hebeloma cylindrosporum]|uniref:Uncharacterized protein n=1 Tax=Hebeloma cylindrosporum TaxID=76867 RepID=A0A0C3CJH6_HEBCY|nr:hypothetical protein M413DRAFT_442977 [Hebeloma cylindrosporum h7]